MLLQRALVGLMTLILAAFVTPVAAEATPACTETATADDQSFTGTAGDDTIVLCTGGFTVTLTTLAGNDDVTILGGGTVTADLGDGDDLFDGTDAAQVTVNGGAGDDDITGSPGDDTIDGGGGADAIAGGIGSDSIKGGDGFDVLSGDSGDDLLDAGDGSDIIDGGIGDDIVLGGQGDDAITGASGNDEVYGGGGTDNIAGSDGDDSLFGQVGSDVISGGDGNDALEGGDGLDSLQGGTGINYCDLDSLDNTRESCLYDDSPPTLTAYTVSLQELDVSEGAKVLTVNVEADDETSVEGGQVSCRADTYLRSAASYLYFGFYKEESAWRIDTREYPDYFIPKISHITRSGSRSIELSFDVTLNADTANGIWICEVNLWDKLRSKVYYAYNAGYQQDVWAPTFNVVGGRNPGDSDPGRDTEDPTINSVSVSPSTIDVGLADQELLLRLDINDNIAVNWIHVTCSSSNGPSYSYVTAQHVKALSAYNWWASARSHSSLPTWDARGFIDDEDEHDFNIDLSLVITEGAFPGIWGCSLQASDPSGNQSRTTFSFEVERTGGDWDYLDVSGPVIESLIFTMVRNDTGTQSGNVVVELALKDETGVFVLWGDCSPASAGNNQVSASWSVVRGSSGWESGYPQQSVIADSDDPKNVVLKLELDIPVGAPPGWWHCGGYANDNLQNRTYFDQVNSFFVYRTPPGMPSQPTGVTYASNTGLLKWREPLSPGSPRLLGYRVQWSNDGVNWNEYEDSELESGLSVVFDTNQGFAADADYWVRVVGENLGTIGRDISLMNLNWATLKIRTVSVPSAPLNLVKSSISRNGFRLAWSASGGAPIYDYVSEYSRDGGTTWLPLESTVSTSTSVTVTGALPGRTYLVRVAGKNASGTSAFLEGSVTTLSSAPTAPSNLAASDVTGSTLTLAWDAPESNGGAAISDYRIEVSSNGGSRWTAIPHTASSSRTFYVSNLRKGTAYKFRVAAVNSIGIGLPSPVIDVTTPTSVPGTPGTATVPSVTQRSATLRWTAPTDTGGLPLTNYAVEYSTDAGETWSALTRPVSTATSSNLTGLTPGTAYQFRVAAVNSLGTGAAGSAVSFSTLQGPVNSVAPSVTGSGVVGSTLSAAVGTWSGAPTPTYAYAWLLCTAAQASPTAGGIAPAGCTPIRRATASSYTPLSTQIGAHLMVRVTARNSQGSAIFYSATVPILALAP